MSASPSTATAGAGTEPAAQGPLHGIRVLDFTSFIAGSYGAMLLGDMGAEVFKIESIYGDNARHWGPFIEARAGRSRRGTGTSAASPSI